MHRILVKDFDFAVIDAEMTGRGPEHELIEIAVIRCSGFNFGIIEEWEVKIKPKEIYNADPDSLKVCGYKEEDWKDAMEPEEAMKIFLRKTEDAILVGHGLNNDWFYIMKTLGQYNLTPTFFFKSLDTFSLAWFKLRHDPAIKFLSVKELAKYYGITQDRPHSAMDDARTTYQIFRKIIA